MPIACKLCIMEKGLIGGDIKNLPQTQEEFNDHLESYHHMPVKRPEETDQECWARFLKKYPEAKTCPDCIKRGAPWTK